MKIRAIVDRIEEGTAVLEVEGKNEVLWPVKLLPADVSAGSVLDIDISQNPEAEKQQREKIKNLQDRLKNK